MRKFGFIIALCHTNELLTHDELKVKCQGGDAEHITKAKFIRELANEMVGNEKQKNKKQ